MAIRFHGRSLLWALLAGLSLPVLAQDRQPHLPAGQMSATVMNGAGEAASPLPYGAGFEQRQQRKRAKAPASLFPPAGDMSATGVRNASGTGGRGGAGGSGRGR
jgi:hypothetical protein